MTNRRYPIAQPAFMGNEKKYLMDTIETGWISSIGSYIETFESEFARFHGMKHAIATHNGTIALHLALAAAGITEHDEVIVPDLTFVATANAVHYCHARPVLTDINADDWNISPGEIEKKINNRTKAVIPVHLYGNPAALDEILSLCREHQLLVIEDCAEALGATYKGRVIGSIGDISCFSFFGNKIITTGEGGMCLTNDDSLAERMRILRDHGMNRQKKYWYDHLGFNYRMTNMQAAVGLAQLEQLPRLLGLREHIFSMYENNLKGHPGILMPENHGNRSVNWIFTIRISGIDESQRDNIMKGLRDSGIDTRPVFYPIHQMPFYKSEIDEDQQFPNTVMVAREGISLPTYIGLVEEDIEYITEHLLEQIERINV
jgi:perosamine synthetase